MDTIAGENFCFFSRWAPAGFVSAKRSGPALLNASRVPLPVFVAHHQHTPFEWRGWQTRAIPEAHRPLLLLGTHRADSEDRTEAAAANPASKGSSAQGRLMSPRLAAALSRHGSVEWRDPSNNEGKAEGGEGSAAGIEAVGQVVKVEARPVVVKEDRKATKAGSRAKSNGKQFNEEQSTITRGCSDGKRTAICYEATSETDRNSFRLNRIRSLLSRYVERSETMNDGKRQAGNVSLVLIRSRGGLSCLYETGDIETNLGRDETSTRRLLYPFGSHMPDQITNSFSSCARFR